MPAKTPILIAVALAAAAVAVAVAFGGSASSRQARAATSEVPGEPTVAIVTPRNGARQTSHAAVVRVEIHNFQLAPRQLGREPQFDEGHIRYSLNRVPDCVLPVKLEHAIDSPLGSGRLIGASFDYARYSGPNGRLAERLGTAGSYSPGTRPEIFYHALPPGLYRLTVTLAQNNGATTPFHAVTNFQILQKPGHHPKKCRAGKVPSAKAAARFE